MHFLYQHMEASYFTEDENSIRKPKMRNFFGDVFSLFRRNNGLLCIAI